MAAERLALALAGLAFAVGAHAATLAERIAQAVAGAPLAQLARDVAPGERRIAQAAYAARGGAPLWLVAEPPYQANARALEAIGLMRDAQDKGLYPRDYPVDWLRQRAARALSEDEAVAFDATLTLAATRYLSDLGFGRLDPARLKFELPAQRRRDGLAARVPAALAADGPFARAAASIEPSLGLYPQLVAALARYRALADQGPLPPLKVTRKKVSPGDRYDGLAALRAHLQRHGDLAVPAAGTPSSSPTSNPTPTAAPAPLGPRTASAGAAAPADAPLYDGDSVEAVRRFQARHGLEPDGVLGTGTFEALSVPLAQRVRQIALSLERLRWLGQTPDERFVAINLPEYTLWAVPGRDEGGAPLTMRVIVGATMTGTPVFVDAIEALEVLPYWNVPRSIATKELYPKLVRDGSYLGREDMELVGAQGLAGAELQQALASGRTRIRQKPGAKNALGTLKFVMPNAHDVYLHDTPSRQLFARNRRDFSHGCIRLQDPQALAAFVLRGRSDWDAERVRQAIAAGAHQRVPLSRPVPVLIFYSTVNAGPDGQVRFLRDVYQLDRKLEAALAAR